MKKIYLYLGVIIIELIMLIYFSKKFSPPSSCVTGKSTDILFTDPVGFNNYFLTTSSKQDLLVLPPTSVLKKTEVKKTNNDSNEEHIFCAGTANSFFCNIKGKLFLCTAYHCTKAWEQNFKKIKSYNKTICGDISLLDYKSMVKDGKAISFKKFQLGSVIPNVTFDFPKDDSVFITGYCPDTSKTGKFKSLFIRGIGLKAYKNQFSDTNDVAIQNQMILVKLGKDCLNLFGFSGSPAFNSKGEVVGVATCVFPVLWSRNDTTRASYLGITLFHE